MAWVFFAIGVLFEAAALVIVLRTRARLASLRRIEGAVVGNEERWETATTGPSKRYYFPVVEYAVEGQRPARFTATTGRPQPRPVGERVPVLLDPARPGHVELGTSRALWIVPVALAIAAAPFFVGGAIALLRG